MTPDPTLDPDPTHDPDHVRPRRKRAVQVAAAVAAAAAVLATSGVAHAGYRWSMVPAPTTTTTTAPAHGKAPASRPPSRGEAAGDHGTTTTTSGMVSAQGYRWG